MIAISVAEPSRSEPELAPGPWPSGAEAGAAQKSGGSATLIAIKSLIQIKEKRNLDPTNEFNKLETVGTCRINS